MANAPNSQRIAKHKEADMLIKMERAKVTVRSIDSAVKFLKLVFPEFETRGENTSDK